MSGAFLEEMHRIDLKYRLCWELQLNDEFRWHVYKHRLDSMTDRPVHVLLVADYPSYEPIPLDSRVLDRLRMIKKWSEDPVKFVKSIQEEEDVQEEEMQKRCDSEGEAVARHYRRLFARLAINKQNPDSYWSPGISRRADGVYETAKGPKDEKVLTVVAGERRA